MPEASTEHYFGFDFCALPYKTFLASYWGIESVGGVVTNRKDPKLHEIIVV